LFASPEDTIINFFSILREAESVFTGGCGSIGFAKSPYPISYNFFTLNFKNKISYNDYLTYFNNVGHLNLIKMHKINNTIDKSVHSKYFIELETIETSLNNNTSFAYYYGFVYIENENDTYKISNMELNNEDFLCAAYHGWAHNAELYVDSTYGSWCKLINKRYPTEQIGYIKNIYITGTDGNEYKFKFLQLTNGTDIQVGQFILDKNNQWKPINIDVYSCLNNHRKF
jgi:hypothetical protein